MTSNPRKLSFLFRSERDTERYTQFATKMYSLLSLVSGDIRFVVSDGLKWDGCIRKAIFLLKLITRRPVLLPR